MSSGIVPLPPGLSQKEAISLKDQNHDTEVYTCAVVFSALATLAVAIRVTSRHMKKVAIGTDDVLIVAALIISIAQSIYICIGVRNYGLGRHLWTLDRYQFVNFNKLWYTVGSLQCTALFTTKMSLLILYHRIFITKAFRLVTKILVVVLALWWIGTILADNLICIPVSHNWDPTVPAHCGSKHLIAIIPPIPWIVTDVVVLLMPLGMVWKLHLPVLQRIGLVGLFLLGSFSTFASCFRYSLLFYHFDDITYNLIPATVWTIIELDVTIIAVCLIVSRPWFLKLYPSKLMSWIQKTTLAAQKASPDKPNRSPSANNSRGRWLLFSSFKRLEETPPAVATVSLGEPFEFDIEKG